MNKEHILKVSYLNIIENMYVFKDLEKLNKFKIKLYSKYSFRCKDIKNITLEEDESNGIVVLKEVRVR